MSAGSTRAAVALPPGPRRRLPGAALFALGRDPLAFFTGLARSYGDLAHLRLGREQLFVASHPDLVREVLVTRQKHFHKGRGLERARMLLGNGLLTSEGETHLRQRRLAQPAFHRDRVAGYARVMGAYAERHADRWRDGQPLDVHRAMMALTLGIVGKTLFDADVEGEAQEIGEALTAAFEAFGGSLFSPWGALLDRLPLPRMRRFRRARERLDETIFRMIGDRRVANDGDRGDLLSMLMLARDEEGDGNGMTDLQLRDEAMTLFLAGHETTANALTFAWYALSRHPEVEARLHAEVDAAGAGRGDEPFGFDDVARLPFARQVIAETMRLYPPAWIIGRRAIQPLELGGYSIPSRAILIVSPFTVQRDPRWFPDPDRFDPDRWLPESAAERPKFSYFPFGGGTRFCIGEAFAWTELVVVLATIARRWRLRAAVGHSLALLPSITLRPRGGMPMVAARR